MLHDTETMSRLVRDSAKIMCYRKHVISENYSGHGMSHDAEEPPRDPHGLGLIYPGLQLRLTGMRNTVVMSEDGSVATVVRKVSRVASGRYAVYLPTGLNDLWEDWNRHNVKLLVILKPIKG
jgi:hypothetical protein